MSAVVERGVRPPCGRKCPAIPVFRVSGLPRVDPVWRKLSGHPLKKPEGIELVEDYPADVLQGLSSTDRRVAVDDGLLVGRAAGYGQRRPDEGSRLTKIGRPDHVDSEAWRQACQRRAGVGATDVINAQARLKGLSG